MRLIPGETFLLCVCMGGGRLTPNVIGTPTLTGEGRISSVGPRDCNHFWNDNRLRDCKYPRMLRMVTSIAFSLIENKENLWKFCIENP